MNGWGDELRRIEDYEHTDIPWWVAAIFTIALITMLALAVAIGERL